MNRRGFLSRLLGVAAAVVGIKAATPYLDAAAKLDELDSLSGINWYRPTTTLHYADWDSYDDLAERYFKPAIEAMHKRDVEYYDKMIGEYMRSTDPARLPV